MHLDSLVCPDPPDVELCERIRMLPVCPDADAMSPSARAALSAADVVFCEADVDAGIVPLVAPGVLVELVPVDRDRAPTRAFSLSRARKLASEGWCVVWLVPNNSGRSLAASAEPGRAIEDSVTDACGAGPYAPHPFATPFNGLAG